MRSPDDSAPVRRPDRTNIHRRIEGEALGVAPRYSIQQEVGGVGLGIEAVGYKTLSVRGEPNMEKTCGHIKRVDCLTETIYPTVLATLSLLEAWIKDQHAVV